MKNLKKLSKEELMKITGGRRGKGIATGLQSVSLADFILDEGTPPSIPGAIR